MIFDDEKRRREEAEEFEKIVKEMEKIIEEAFRSAFNMQPFVKGFSLRIDESGKAELKEFGKSEETMEDIIEDENKVYVTVELPDAQEKDIKVRIVKDFLEIRTKNELKEIKLPCNVKKKVRKTFKNGILDIELEKA